MDRVILGRIPSSIQTYHLTLASLCWSALTIAAGFLARTQRGWIWVISLCIILHYLTDHFDGAVGRLRGTGLVRWGYYMDHFLDFIFLCAVCISYLVIFPVSAFWIAGLLAVCGAFMVQSYLLSLVTDRFYNSFYWFGPVEFWIILLGVNAALFFLGAHVAVFIFRALSIAALLGLCVVVYRMQRTLWNSDMEDKKNQHGD